MSNQEQKIATILVQQEISYDELEANENYRESYHILGMFTSEDRMYDLIRYEIENGKYKQSYISDFAANKCRHVTVALDDLDCFGMSLEFWFDEMDDIDLKRLGIDAARGQEIAELREDITETEVELNGMKRRLETLM